MKKIKRALELNLNYFLRRRTPILVYSMERSGSTAMFSSLETHKAFVIGAHYLDPDKLGTGRFSGSSRWACRHIIQKRKPAKVIGLVRNPLENMLSTFARTEYGKQGASQSEAESQAGQLSPEQLSDDFCQTYLETDRYLWPLGWFANEFQAALGINVYEHAFDKQNGFARFREDPYDVLILRTELPDVLKAELVADFVGIPSFEIMRSTAVGSNDRRRLPSGKPGDLTHYSAKYRALKQSVVIPQAYLDAIVDSCHVQHFFTQEERDAMQARYRGAVPQEL